MAKFRGHVPVRTITLTDTHGVSYALTMEDRIHSITTADGMKYYDMTVFDVDIDLKELDRMLASDLRTYVNDLRIKSILFMDEDTGHTKWIDVEDILDISITT